MEMYKRVLEDSLEFPNDFDPITCNFLTGLLEKEACERIGWGEDGVEEIKAHPYFNFIQDWDHVGQLKLRPPYIPFIQNDQDVSNFDEMFTNLPVKISQSSHVFSNNNADDEEEEDPFQGFSFDNVVQQTIFNNNNTNTTIPPLIDTSNFTSVVRIRKRHSAALLSFTSSPSSNSNNHQLFEDNRVLKKRQTNANNISAATQNEQEEEEEEEGDESSIYSRSSLSFSFAAQEATTATRAGSEFSIEPSTNCALNTTVAHNERPHCPIPGQSRVMITSERGVTAAGRSLSIRSNASTLNDSICSYLTLENDISIVVQHQHHHH